MSDNVSNKSGVASGMVDSRGVKGFQLMILSGVFVIGLIATGFIAEGIGSISGISERASLIAVSVVQCLLAFCFPAWVMARFTTKDTMGSLSLKGKPAVRALLGVVIVYILAMPALNQVIDWNEAIHFPESMKWLEDSLRRYEEAASAVSGKILSSTGAGALIVSLSVVGLLTGFSEELFFRGSLQNILSFPHRRGVAIWGTAIIFSAIHFQFFGFIPRVLMGAFFGYLLVWTGSLWVAVFAHALNNSIVVISCWMAGRWENLYSVESFGIAAEGEFPWAALASFFATLIFLWRFRNYFFRSSD